MIFKILIMLLICIALNIIMILAIKIYRSTMYKIFVSNQQEQETDEHHKEHWWSTRKVSFFPLYITLLLHATLLTFYGNYMTNVMIRYIGNEEMFGIACMFNLIMLIPANLYAASISCYKLKKPFTIATIAGSIFTLTYIIIIVSRSVAFLLSI